ncbi:hypothetical protein EV177_000062 [Coemansia sp. RSA 1804]|nr:hypothetical protein EV177_000062 [Coemansia sp. RSA 1804]
MADLKNLPDELRDLAPYLQRAHEVAKVDPVVSYFSKYYAVRVGITGGGSSSGSGGDRTSTKESQAYLAGLMDQLEDEKKRLGADESMRDDGAASRHCATFALRVFAKADTEDREMRATRTTARNFIVASQFLQIVAAFGPLPDDVAEKIRYAKWRAAEILRAIREGRQPSAPSGAAAAAAAGSVAQGDGSGGNADEMIMGWPSPPNAARSPGPNQPPPTTAAAAAAAAAATLPSASAVSAGPQSWSGGYPTVASPGAGGSGFHPQQPAYHHNQHMFQQQPSSTPPPPPPPPPQQMQMSAAPSDSVLPSVPHLSPHPHPHPAHGGGYPPANNTSGGANPAHSHAHPGAPAAAAPAGVAAFIPVPAASLPSAMTNAGSGRAEDSADDAGCLDPTAVKSAQKHARWAISALEYDDVETSIENLQKAIRILAPFRRQG